MSAHGSSKTGSKTSTGMASSTTTPANAGLGEDRPRAFDAQGAIGKQFTGKVTPSRFYLPHKHFAGSFIGTEVGALGGAAQKIGGPLAKEGMIGKQFTTEGSIGGSVQSSVGGTKGRSN
ncbi:hypothetical protein F4824DRAFT_283382 [Ustulina deusta]|nr:hypothetical protein F4824DRAFT_283382 [Ustulina deusta]